MVAINVILLPECTGEECAGDNDICTDSRVQHRNAENRAPVARNHRSAPVLGRRLTRDPIGYAGGINLYEYVAERAVVAVDPSGLLTEADCGRPLNRCVDNCWNRRPTPYPWRRDKWYYDHCQEICNAPYLDCLDRLKPAECPSPLPAIDVVGEVGATAAAGAEEISVGDIVIEVVIGTALF